MHTNVLGPMRMVAQIAEALAPGARVAVLSSRMGSISLRAEPNSWLYRASKAAVFRGLDEPSLEAAIKGQNRYPAVAALFSSEDFVEGPLAFSQKRAPNWKGR
jgi:enoyl-CoA hydratase/carnithine racemase